MFMARLRRSRTWTDESGAVAALYALALPALVGIAGLGFDYARLASMDTELQNAADQAALAAATQLDRQEDAISRGRLAATGLLTANKTLFANDGKGLAVSDLTVRFYATKSNAEVCGNTGLLTDQDSQAAFVCVTANPRTARYALTPIVGALSGVLGAQAVAGLGSAVCRVPSLMICNPSEPAGNTDPNFDFDANAYTGVGLLALDKWAPGDFGFLDNGKGANGIEQALAWTSPTGDCQALEGVDTIDVDTEAGRKASAIDAVNTRFDIYDNCPDGGACPASLNSIKDLTHAPALDDGKACTYGENGETNGWSQPAARYLPTTNSPVSSMTVIHSMGHPRDICHSTDPRACTGPIGDGFWDRDAYFRTHYPAWTDVNGINQWQLNTGLAVSSGTRPRFPTRYQVYLWEIANAGYDVKGETVLAERPVGGRRAAGTPICSPVKGYGEGSRPPEAADRRRVTVAVINCKAEKVNGAEHDVPVRRWIDVFLVQPSAKRDRTTKFEIYAEIIGETPGGSGGESPGSIVRRDVPYLVR